MQDPLTPTSTAAAAPKVNGGLALGMSAEPGCHNQGPRGTVHRVRRGCPAGSNRALVATLSAEGGRQCKVRLKKDPNGYDDSSCRRGQHLEADALSRPPPLRGARPRVPGPTVMWGNTIRLLENPAKPPVPARGCKALGIYEGSNTCARGAQGFLRSGRRDHFIIVGGDNLAG